MRHLRDYKIFEASAHWRDDVMPKLNWDRMDEIYDLMIEFEDIGWTLPKRQVDMTNSYMFDGIKVEMSDSSFNTPSKKIDLIERQFYQSYRVRAINPSRAANFDIEFFKEVVEILSKLKGLGYEYKIGNISKDNIDIMVYHPEDVIDPSLVIADMKKAKVSLSIGIDNAEQRLDNHRKIMNIDKKDGRLYITQITDKYNLDRVYDIVNKTLKDKFNVIKDDTNNRVIVATKGKYV